MLIIDKRKRRKRGVVRKVRIEIKKYAIIFFLLLILTAILGVFISHFFSYDTEKIFYVENEPVNQNKPNDKDANRVMMLAGEFFKKRIDEIQKLSKK